MITLSSSLAAWGSDTFDQTLKQELQQVPHSALPLQAGLIQSSHVSDSPFQVSVLSAIDTEQAILARIGVFYQGIIAGSCCADDPSPVEEQNEYSELEVRIDKITAAATIAPVAE